MFTLRVGLTIVIAAVAAALIAPFIAPAVAWAGFHFPFARIFDRVVMVTMAIALWCQAGQLKLMSRLRAGFSRPIENLPAALCGLATGAAAIAVLWALARLVSGVREQDASAAAMTIITAYLIPALAIAVIEEGFFRAFLLDGLAEDFGPRAGLMASSVVYAVAHLIRSSARFEVRTVRPAAGLVALGSSLAQLRNPVHSAPALLGLFLLGVLLGEAFIATRRVYFSIGLHSGLIAGAKAWGRLIPDAQSLPRWLSGYARPPLISGAAAWLITLIVLILVRLLTKPWAVADARPVQIVAK